VADFKPFFMAYTSSRHRRAPRFVVVDLETLSLAINPCNNNDKSLII
jgi:hypothetical protein